MSSARRAFDWLFRNRQTGKITIAQSPNVSLAVFLVCALLLRLWDPSGDARTVLMVGRTAALLIWALDEVVRGVNPWRRALGVAVLAATLFGLLWG